MQRGWWHLFQGSKDEVQKGQALFREAGELAPRFSLAFSGLAVSHLYQLGYQWSKTPAQSLADSVEAAERAVALGEDEPQAHFLAEQYEKAIAWEKKSLQSRKDQPGAYRVLAASYGFLGRADEARTALGTMRELAPDFSLEALRLRLPSAVVERYLEGWRKAGWKG